MTTSLCLQNITILTYTFNTSNNSLAWLKVATDYSKIITTDQIQLSIVYTITLKKFCNKVMSKFYQKSDAKTTL